MLPDLTSANWKIAQSDKPPLSRDNTQSCVRDADVWSYVHGRLKLDIFLINF